MPERISITAEIVDIGNSKGLRIPKGIREQLGLAGKVTLTVAGDSLVVKPKHHPRADWAERFAKKRSSRPDPLLLPDLETDFDSEWTW